MVSSNSNKVKHYSVLYCVYVWQDVMCILSDSVMWKPVWLNGGFEANGMFSPLARGSKRPQSFHKALWRSVIQQGGYSQEALESPKRRSVSGIHAAARLHCFSQVTPPILCLCEKKKNHSPLYTNTVCLTIQLTFNSSLHIQSIILLSTLTLLSWT